NTLGSHGRTSGAASAPEAGGQPGGISSCSTRPRYAPRDTATGVSPGSHHPGPPPDDQDRATPHGTCGEPGAWPTGTPGSEGGPRKRAGRKASTAPWSDPTTTRSTAHRTSNRYRARQPSAEGPSSFPASPYGRRRVLHGYL